MADEDMQRERVLVFDFGSQFVQLIARRVRENNVYCEIVRHDLTAERVRELAPKGIIFSGGPNSVYEAGAPRCDPAIFDLGIPILGICYGMQLVCEVLGGSVRSNPSREFGRTDLEVTANDPLFANVPRHSVVWMSHGDQVTEVSADFASLARTPTCPIAAVRHRTRPVYCIQFHPEVTHTACGMQVLANFLRDVCVCRGDWRLENFLEAEIGRIRQRVGGDRVVCGLSGGVDSAVTAAMVHRAIGDQLCCIFVDNGLLRLGERAAVERTFRDHFHADLRVVEASDLFLGRLKCIVDPQEKRKRIGHAFIEVFRAQAKSIASAKFLAQGTLYPDVIESGAAADGPAATIKTHHNVGGLPEELGFELLEPLRDLFKDEVRRLGEALGLPKSMVWRHPFPGPGLAVRCLGEVRQERLDVLRQADAVFMEELERCGAYGHVAQAFAVLLPVRTVGVMGDYRTYDEVLALRAVTTDDYMTADWARLDPELLARISTRIINEVRGVNRVVYDISTKPPATIEWE